MITFSKIDVIGNSNIQRSLIVESFASFLFFSLLSLRVRKMINLKNESASRVGSRGSVDESDESKMNRACVCVCVC